MIGKTNVKVKPNKKVQYVEYIESTGTQYIDTGVVPTSKTKWVYDYQFLSDTSSGTGDSAQNGCGIANNAKRFVIGYGSGNFSTAIGVNGATNVTGDTNRHVFILDAPNKKGYVDSAEISCTYSSISATDSICFFTRNENGTKSAFIHAGRLYGSKIYEDGVLIRDFKPCKDGAGVYCLYDEVEKRYYYNQGSNEFVEPGYSIDVPENTKLLMKFEDNLNDETGKNTASLKAGLATYVPGKFGKAIYLPHGDYVSIPLTTETTLGTNNFTIAGWFMLEDTSNSNCLWSFAYEYSSSYYYQGIQVWHNSTLKFSCDLSSSGKNSKTTSKSLTANVWYHIALVRYNGTLTLYVDGVSVGTLSANGTVYQNTNNDWKIGASSSTSQYPIRETFKGKIDDFIIVNGTALWTANFTPPTHEYGGLIQ